MINKSQFFDLNIQTVGVLDSYKTQDGFEPETVDRLPRNVGHMDLVVTMDGKVFIGNTVLTYLCGRTQQPYGARLGGLYFYEWDRSICQDAIRHALYPARNDRETWTRNRNLAIIKWLEKLAQGLNPDDELAMYRCLPDGRVPADYAYDNSTGRLIDRVTRKSVDPWTFMPMREC